MSTFGVDVCSSHGFADYGVEGLWGFEVWCSRDTQFFPSHEPHN